MAFPPRGSLWKSCFFPVFLQIYILDHTGLKISCNKKYFKIQRHYFIKHP